MTPTNIITLHEKMVAHTVIRGNFSTRSGIQLGSLLVTALHRSVFVDFNHGQQLLGDEFA